MDSNDNVKIAIIGAGVIGSTVGKFLQNEMRNANVTIIADNFGDETTSCVAAGIFRPGPSFKGPTKEITKKWIEESWNFWQEIMMSPDSLNAGIIPLPTYIFSKDNYHVTRNHLIENIVPIYRAVDGDELTLCGEGWKYGSYFLTLKIECDKYLPWNEIAFKVNGGKIVKSKVDSFRSLSEFDLVFNCTGMGAKYLCNDHDLVPIRGQVLRVNAPWIKTSFYGDYDTYIIPGSDGLATLGGVRQYDSYNLQVCKHDAAAILERCCQLVPSLNRAEIISHKVGLRPHRTPVRVEAEIVDGLKVVHCYGHGGYGVMCAPGTAIDAVKLGIDILKTNSWSKL